MEQLVLFNNKNALNSFVDWARETICLNNTDDEIINGLKYDEVDGYYYWTDNIYAYKFMYWTKKRGNKIIHKFKKLDYVYFLPTSMIGRNSIGSHSAYY